VAQDGVINVSGSAIGDILVWDGSNWVAGTDGDNNSLNEIQNISIFGNQVNISNGGTGFDLSPVAPTDGNVLTWNGILGQWEAQPSGSSNSWNLIGNTGTSATDFIGTTDAQDFKFRTNNVERMIITQTGNIGIGVSAPLAPFHLSTDGTAVVGVMSAGSFGEVSMLRSNGTKAAPTNVLQNDLVGQMDFIGYNAVQGWGAGLVGSIRMVATENYTSSNFRGGKMIFSVSGNSASGTTQAMTIENNGNIGIGTSTPSEKLEVIGKTKTDEFQMTGGSPVVGYVLTSDAAGNASWQAPSAGTPAWNIGGNAGTLASDFIGTTDAQNFRIYTNNTEKMVVTQFGTVGIGVSNPLGDLHVAANTNSIFINQVASNTSNVQSGMLMTRSRGTIASPTALQNGDSFGEIGFMGHDGTAFGQPNAGMRAEATQNFSPTGYGTKLLFSTTPNGDVDSYDRLVIDNNGNVGIGTTTPNNTLHVNGTFQLQNASAAVGYVLTATDALGNASWQPVTGGSGWNLNGNAGTSATDFIGTTDAQDVRFRTNNVERMVITQTGNVGIGTTNPFTPFHVVTEEIQSGLAFQSSNNSVSGNSMVVLKSRGTKLVPSAILNGDYIGGFEMIGYDGVDFGANGPTAGMNARATENFTAANQGTSLIFSTTSNGSNTSQERMIISNNGNVGIGTTTPSATLDVVGSFQLQNASAAVGYVLTATDALGNAEWQPAAGGGTRLNDSDNDTYIEVEQAADEDIIRFYDAGVEYFTMNNGRIDVLNTNNSTFMGRNSGVVNTGTNNTGYGFQTLQANTSGQQNTAIGGNALLANQTGSFNVAIGNQANQNGTATSGNVAVGYRTLLSNTASNIVAVGNAAMQNNTTGTQNTAIGYQALFANTDGSFNTALGYDAGRFMVSSFRMTAIGNEALRNNTGADNTAVGAFALDANTTAANNTAVGSNALSTVTTGGNNTAVGTNSMVSSTGFQNTAVGSSSLTSNTSGNNNNAFGFGAMGQNTLGSGNSAFGNSALSSNISSNNNSAFGMQALNTTSGANNTAIGYDAGSNNTSGFTNLFVGYNANASTGNLNNASAIGPNALVSQSNSMVLGDNAVNIGMGTSSPSTKLHINGGHIRHQGTAPSNTTVGSSHVRGAFTASGGSGSITIVYTDIFSAAPFVTVTPLGSGDLGASFRFWISNNTATGFTLNWSGNSGPLQGFTYMIIE
jgi:hypothetical protein